MHWLAQGIGHGPRLQRDYHAPPENHPHGHPRSSSTKPEARRPPAFAHQTSHLPYRFTSKGR